MKRTAAFATLLAWCFLLLAGRVVYTGSLSYAFLAWNLFLASIPAFAATRLVKANAEDRSRLLQISWALLWLAFLPNAPYIATDFLHLRPRPFAPLWYDVALLLSCTVTGLLLGFSSIADVQRVVARRFGPIRAWLCSASALVLSGFGIYLGRFLRWNTWDVATNPIGLFADVAQRFTNPLSHPRTFGVTAVYGCGLLVGYVAFSLLGPLDRGRQSRERRFTRRRGVAE